MKQFKITPNDAEQRLDKFLKKLFPEASLSFLYKLNRTNKIKILDTTGKKTKQEIEYKLQVGEEVQIYLNDQEIAQLQKKASTQQVLSLSQGKMEQIARLSKQDIIFEDESLLFINKSAGLNVHPWDHKSEEVSLIQQVHDYYGDTLSSLTFQPSLVHRIDRDTSWLIMIAKQKEALTKMSEAFQKKDALQKIYFALVLGKLSRKEGTIKKPLERVENAKNENKVRVSEGWQEAITHYKVLDEYSLQLPEGLQIISALEVTIETGRMHQIRVHMAHIWNPILWDKAYGNKKINSYFVKNYGITRHMLHAWKISFFHPKSNKKMKLEAKLKEDMLWFLKKLGK